MLSSFLSISSRNFFISSSGGDCPSSPSLGTKKPYNFLTKLLSRVLFVEIEASLFDACESQSLIILENISSCF